MMVVPVMQIRTVFVHVCHCLMTMFMTMPEPGRYPGVNMRVVPIIVAMPVVVFLRRVRVAMAMPFLVHQDNRDNHHPTGGKL